MLCSAEAIANGHAAFDELHDHGDAEILAATLMPDHVHVLFRLGGRLSLDRVVAKWKARLTGNVASLAWQPNYFDHRLRTGDSAEDYAFYVFMNPYRAGLLGLDAVWPGWWTKGRARWAFLESARPGPCPQVEWLDRVETQLRGLTTGES